MLANSVVQLLSSPFASFSFIREPSASRWRCTTSCDAIRIGTPTHAISAARSASSFAIATFAFAASPPDPRAPPSISSPSLSLTLPCLHAHLQMGHQAAQCTSGTVNWRQIYGDKAFILRGPIYWSDELARKKQRNVDASDLERRAREFAKVRPGGPCGCCTRESFMRHLLLCITWPLRRPKRLLSLLLRSVTFSEPGGEGRPEL